MFSSYIALSNVIAVVTGAGWNSCQTQAGTTPLGIGAATALQFAIGGARVMLVDRDLSAGEKTLGLIAQNAPESIESGRVVLTVADVDSETDSQRIAVEVVDHFGSVTALVNNVGVAGPPGTAANVDLSHWSNTMDVNLRSMVVMSRALLPSMISVGEGSIINMSSLAGIRGGHHALCYPTTKSAVIGLTISMAAHHGPEGIRVNAVVPGLVYTPMVAVRGLSEEQRRQRSGAGMLQTEGTAWDVASAAAFLASDASRWITGVALPVDGGLSNKVANLGVGMPSVDRNRTCTTT